MKKALAISAAPIFALLCGCASQPLPVEELQADAAKAADQRGALELGCEAMTAQVLRQETRGLEATARPLHNAYYCDSINGWL